ncbi:type I DNA topoisomerase [Gemmata sp. G18]|uniref:DNA topoisomerase 1 n=1 Tax=Gemmata palustris TaxID=2822762 RepID=A0ABS5BLT8_9BACT|nr:type I DNA topoisomerase [Gemmata palustris]MBP3954656.1 type I DNA topoisomerase [Gemmata palustris]
MPTPKKNAAADKPAAAKKPRAKKAPAKSPAPDTPDAPAAPSGPRGNYDLVVVESPAKAKTINKYLGPNFRVLASYGHVRDLDTKKKKGEDIAGIDITNGWKLRYTVDDGSKDAARGGRKFRSAKDILAEIGREAARANNVYLASDPDREGESIAWHIADELKLPDERTFRIRFNEITKNAVTAALSGAEKINDLRVAAQEARRAMDRVVGFPLSNLLGKKVANKLSAGRVQSVAVKLIVDREREIEAFKTEEYWKITALLAAPGVHVAWTSDPAKSKIFAKKKTEVAKPVAWHKPSEEDTQGDPDEPVVDTETSDAPPEPGEGGEAPATPVADGSSIPTPPTDSFLANLVKWDNADPKLTNETEADVVVASLAGVPFVVTRVEQKDRLDRPLAPFTTSTLQQQANARMKFSASRTMQTAQKLYEGIELSGMGQTALITYMRTDSTRVSNDALATVRDFIKADARLGANYLPAAPNTYASNKGAQEGHEAIRPTDVTITPARAQAAGLGGDQLRLYELIWKRFVASQCVPAKLKVTTYDITAGRGLFRASGRVIAFDGYRRVLPPVGKQEDAELPPVKEKDVLNRLDLFESQHFTQPPPRFNEGSLVKSLEKEGIGRPSTYASIISTIQKRGYVTQDRGRFFATEIGKVVTDLLVKHFPDIMDLKFTSHFEDELDEIETGKFKYRDVLDEFWGKFSPTLKKADTEMPVARELTGEMCPKCGKPLQKRYSATTGGFFVGCTGYSDDPACKYIQPRPGETEREGPMTTDIPCPACGKFMVRKVGRFGVFYTCEGAPECPTTMNENAEGVRTVTALPTKHKCPKCEKHNLLLKESKVGKKYVQCPDPKCKFISDADADGAPVKPADTGIACEKCGSPMVIKVAWRGPFLSCSGFPKCRNAKSINAELKEKLKDILPPMPEKSEKKKEEMPAVEISDTCPECGAAMKLMKSRFGPGYYLGCSKYPKCKGKGKMTPELQAKIDAATAAAAQAPA